MLHKEAECVNEAQHSDIIFQQMQAYNQLLRGSRTIAENRPSARNPVHGLLAT